MEMRILIVAAVLVAAAPAYAQSTPAQGVLAQNASAQSGPKYSTNTTMISEMLANPAAKAVLEKHLGALMQFADQVGNQTLKQVQGMAEDQLPDDVLDKIDADLAKIK
jgi:4-aminobutyrate aminotransferase-like enzyme